AVVAVEPPGGNGEMRVMALVGKLCAAARPVTVARANAAAKCFIPPPSLECEATPMLIDFFLKLKSHKLPVSIKEYLTLLEAMGKNVIGPSVDDFYYLSRTALVKDEANYDKFDRAFAEFWQGVETIPGIEAQIPLEWLLKQVELTLSEEEKKQIAALGGWE